MDEVEAYAYTKLLPKIQDFAERRLGSGGAAKLPIPQCEYKYQTLITALFNKKANILDLKTIRLG